MFRAQSTFAFTLLWTVLAAAQSPSADLALAHVAVINTHDGSIQPDMTVQVTHGQITAVQKASGAKLPKATLEIDASGKFLIPGLWDMHVHLAQADKVRWTRPFLLPLLVANGITAVRDMGGDFDVLQQLRSDVAQQKVLGPRIVAAGPQLIGTGSEKIWPAADWPPQEFARVGTAADGEQTVRALKTRGVDFIKVQSQGPPIPRAAYFAIADTARKLGIAFVGHVPDAVGAEEASNAGQQSIEHLSGIFLACSTKETELRKAAFEADLAPSAFPVFSTRASLDLPPRGTFETYNEEKTEKLFAALAKNHTWQVPTLSIKQSVALSAKGTFYRDPRLAYIPSSFRTALGPADYYRHLQSQELADVSISLDKSLSVVREMHRAGVEFLAGTDLPYPALPGWSLHDELSLLVRGGLSPLEALQAATLNPARFLEKTGQFGTVEVGKVADLALLDANPLLDIENVRAVVLNGRYLGREELDGILQRAKAAAVEPESP